MENEIDELLKESCPWQDPSNKEWYIKDGDLRELIEAEKQGLFHPPKIKYVLEKKFFGELFKDPNKYGILILRGPRRIGKSSTLKYLIKESVDKKEDPNRFVYLSLDREDLFKGNEKRKFLRELIKNIINKYKKENKPLVLILDEVTFYEGWCRAFKNLIDEGIVGPGIGMIATGSYSLDLSSAKRELSGRFGPLGEAFNGDIFMYPRKFIELSESLLGEDFKNFVARNFGYFAKRCGMIEYLANYQTKENSIKFDYEQLLNQILYQYYDDLHELFREIYLYSGGYPRSFYKAILSKSSGRVAVSDSRYIEDIYSLLVTDSKKFRLSEETLKDILKKIEFPSMEITYTSLIKLKKEEVEKYISYLKASGLFAFIPYVSSSTQIDVENLLVTSNREKLKLIVTDPAAFIAIYMGSRGITGNVIEHTKEIFAQKEKIKELLFESIVVSHLLRSPIFRKSSLIENVCFVKKENEELVDSLAWYVNWKNELVLVAVEAKTGNIDLKEIKRKSKILKDEFKIRRLIVVSNNKELKIEEDYVIIPIEIFLLFL